MLIFFAFSILSSVAFECEIPVKELHLCEQFKMVSEVTDQMRPLDVLKLSQLSDGVRKSHLKKTSVAERFRDEVKALREVRPDFYDSLSGLFLYDMALVLQSAEDESHSLSSEKVHEIVQAQLHKIAVDYSRIGPLTKAYAEYIFWQNYRRPTEILQFSGYLNQVFDRSETSSFARGSNMSLLRMTVGDLSPGFVQDAYYTAVPTMTCDGQNLLVVSSRMHVSALAEKLKIRYELCVAKKGDRFCSFQPLTLRKELPCELPGEIGFR